MNAEEIVKGLRWLAKVRTYCEAHLVNCRECEFHGFCTDPYDEESIGQQTDWLNQAADLIESLTAQLAELDRLRAENERLRAKLDDPRTVTLPCKVGDTIWRPDALQYSWDIVFATVYPDEIDFTDDSDNVFTADDLGKTVFLTREAAEAAKEAQGK